MARLQICSGGSAGPAAARYARRVADTAMLWAGGGRGGDLYRMGNGLLIFARANCDANRLFHGALLSTVNYLLIVISALNDRLGGGVPSSAWCSLKSLGEKSGCVWGP